MAGVISAAGAGRVGGSVLDSFPLRNSRWLRRTRRSGRPPGHGAGVVTLPLALLGYLAVCGQLALSEPAFALPFGPRPEVFIPLMLVIGVFCSAGALCWNEASQRLPTVLVGPLIVFEILAGWPIPSAAPDRRRC